MNPIFPFFGGKRRVARVVWERLGDVPHYIEPFLGSGAVLLARTHPPQLETVNDLDSLLANFFRAAKHDPEGVAEQADNIVAEVDLHARHLWLVNEGRERCEKLKTDPDYYDVKAAGWWLWGICMWIGGGWCSGEGPHRKPDHERGIMHQLPYLSANGMGIHRKVPYLRSTGLGVHRKIPRLSCSGQGIHAPQEGTASTGSCAERRAHLVATISELSDRLRGVRICSGNWDRVVGPSVLGASGLTGVFLDPPYELSERHNRCYAMETDVAQEVREWAAANGDNPQVRIALCGYESGAYSMPESWSVYRWKAPGGYGSQANGRGRENAARETIWFSPHCIPAGGGGLFASLEEDDGEDPEDCDPPEEDPGPALMVDPPLPAPDTAPSPTRKRKGKADPLSLFDLE